MASIDATLARFLSRLPFGARLAGFQSRIASFGEQGLQGVANVLVNIVLARALPHDPFAAIGTMIGIHFFVLGLHRSAIVLPFILDAAGDDAKERAAEGRWWWLNVLSVVLIGVLLALSSLAANIWLISAESAWFVEGLALTVFVTPALLMFEFGRRVLYQRRLPVTAAIASAVYLVINVGIAYQLTQWDRTAQAGAVAWTAAGVAGAIICTLAALPPKPHLGEALGVWWRNREFSFWQALTNFPHAVYNSSAVVLVGAFGGAPAVAAFSAARTLTNPATSIVTAVDSLDKPRAARALASDGVRGLKRSIGQTRRLLAVLTGGYLGLIALFATPILSYTLGPAYAGLSTEIRVLALVFFLICLNQPSEAFLIVLRASKLLLATRTISACVALAVLYLAQPWGVLGSCIGLLIVHALHLVMLLIAEHIAGAHWTRAADAAKTDLAYEAS